MESPGVAPATSDGMPGVHHGDFHQVETGQLGEEEGRPTAHDAPAHHYNSRDISFEVMVSI